MLAVGRIGSYISRGVYTVSGPFHPFGGAVDIIVVEQQDGSYKSTPWYVRFGKFQGVLKATERVVSINVNGVDANFHMYLDRQGEAFFLREVDIAEGESESYPYSADEMEVKPDAWGAQKSMSCNYEVDKTKVVPELEESNRKSLTRNNSRREKIFGLPFGRRSMKENGFQNREASVEVDGISSLKRAEIAADLLEVRWSTNLHTGKNQNPSAFDGVKVNSSISSNGKSDTQHSCSINPDNSMEFIPEKAYVEADSNGVDNSSVNDNQTAWNGTSEVSQLVDLVKIEGGASSVEAPLDNECDTLENIATSFGNEEALSNAAEVKFGDELGTTQCSIDKGLTGDVIVKKDGEGLHMEDSTTDNHFQTLTRLLDESSSGELSAGTSYLNSLHSVSKKECAIANVSRSSISSSETDHIRDSTESNNTVALSYVSKEEQFVFSDLDDSEVEKLDHTRNLSSGSEECLSQGSLESNEVAVSDTIISNESHQMTMKPTQDNPLINHPSIKNNSNKVSSPMSISTQHNNADEEALAPVAESLPNMVFNGDNLPINVSQPVGHSLDSTLDAFRMASNDVPVASTSTSRQQQVVHSQLTADGAQISMEIKKIISDPAVEVSLCRHFLFEGMGYEAAACAFDSEKLDIDNFLSLGHELLGNNKLVVRIGGLYFPWDAAMPIASAIGSQGKEQVLEPKGMIAVGQVDNDTSDRVAQNSISSQNGSWKIWPFSFKRSNSSLQSRNSSSETAAERPRDMAGNNGAAVTRVAKKKMRTKMPTSEQLASLNLKEGKNVVTFTFSTAMLGEQQVDARIFLWKWNARIVISDVDGTITKSDVLGQFMPMMGMDWSQTGVTHLFSAIKENGYQLVFLSARSISQAYHTRQFLINLKQDGKALPEGPVLISPDGLFPSLYREVIRRAPHEFKIACLEDVKVLFSPDHNPFYAGFGNRDTDELSYLKMGIPKGKIFTINPKGQVVVNRRVDSKSYTSLHALVHDMFPPTTLHEQEDYNSWNFWRLPPPDGII